jgi:hypothetical protein
MFSTGQATVGTTAVQILTADSELPTKVTLTCSVNNQSLYFGDSSVTTSTGLSLFSPVAGWQYYYPTITLPPGQELWAISSGSVFVSYMAVATAAL